MCTLLVVLLSPVPLQPSEWAFLRSHRDAPTVRAGGPSSSARSPKSVPVRATHPSRASQASASSGQAQDVWPAPLPVGPRGPPLCPSPPALSLSPPWWPCIGHMVPESCGSGCLSPQAFLLEHPKRGAQISREVGLDAILGDSNLKSWSH